MLAHRFEGEAAPGPGEDCVRPARSVFDSIHASIVGDPTRSSLKLRVAAVRVKLERGAVWRQGWVDTRDMWTDGGLMCTAAAAVIRARSRSIETGDAESEYGEVE